MHLKWQRSFLWAGLAIAASCGLLAACAPVIGYPTDPENTDATLANLQPYFNGLEEQKYFALADSNRRALKRNEIILGRTRAYDIEFADFERRLYGDGNGVTLGADLIGLILGGLTATTGSAATKSALGAASTGVIGAKAAIDKDLYYQKTIPALLAQMEADRLRALEPITKGMKLSDADYPLMLAYIDLDAYKTTGSIPAAINAFNKEAGKAKAEAQALVAALRTTVFAEDTYSQRLRDFIWPSGISQPFNKTNRDKVRQWIATNLGAAIPLEKLLYAAPLADARKQAALDLSIP